MPDEQHPEWWYTAVYVEDSTLFEDSYLVYAQHGEEPRPVWTDRVLAQFVAKEPAEQFVAFWNATHAAPGAPLVEDAGEVGAFLDADSAAGPAGKNT